MSAASVRVVPDEVTFESAHWSMTLARVCAVDDELVPAETPLMKNSQDLASAAITISRRYQVESAPETPVSTKVMDEAEPELSPMPRCHLLEFTLPLSRRQKPVEPVALTAKQVSATIEKTRSVKGVVRTGVRMSTPARTMPPPSLQGAALMLPAARPKPNPMGGWVIAWKCMHCTEEGYDHQADETGLKIKDADRGTYQLRGAG